MSRVLHIFLYFFVNEVFREMIGLRMIRNKKKLSQLKVAMDLSISREALSYYENGKRSPDISMLLLLSDYFDVSIDYLIRGEEFCSKKDS